VSIGAGGLADAILYLLQNPDLRKKLGKQAFRSLSMYYDIHRVINYYEELYGAVCQGLPVEALPTMKEHMWPIYNPFVENDSGML
jgi:hypothetical protein